MKLNGKRTILSQVFVISFLFPKVIKLVLLDLEQSPDLFLGSKYRSNKYYRICTSIVCLELSRFWIMKKKFSLK